ncbi:DNA polymerase III subunit gamma and tau [Pseudonocardia sp. H11422]|uniref:DNA polymerase III subunit gamma and tau n=1 Tax=Pseudonocardia sp. H11422 TaxID=2835866 RepID=UPI001BDC01F2|nr:DNA polymerase III subunit gamma and tau [Pseudonocardia sp. H11422]
MALALYRKYRPAKFAEVVGQEHVTEPLGTALSAGRINHAYLFSGPRGCGKTSSARILARSLNCELGPTPDPCGVCPSCVALAPEGPGSIDVVELDAASHGGVDDARELRDRAFYAPAESRYRVFIVDEAHMVTPQGFNALLKIVEEPPDHLVFVFATTEPDKVLPTIRSRTHHYPFRLIPPGTLRRLLERICADEGAVVAPAVYPLVIRAGGGSARDTLSVLDQLLAGAGPEGVTYERAVALLGVTDVALIDDVVDALAAGDRGAVYEAVDRLVEAGHDPRRFAADLLQRIRDLTLLQAVPEAAARGLVDTSDDELTRMAEQAANLGPATLARYGEILHDGLTEMRGATAPRLLLELLCARMLLPAASTGDSALLERLERMERRISIAPEPGTGGETLPPAVAEAPPPGRRTFVRPTARQTAEAAGPAGGRQPTAAPGGSAEPPAAAPPPTAAPAPADRVAEAPAAPVPQAAEGRPDGSSAPEPTTAPGSRVPPGETAPGMPAPSGAGRTPAHQTRPPADQADDARRDAPGRRPPTDGGQGGSAEPPGADAGRRPSVVPAPVAPGPPAPAPDAPGTPAPAAAPAPEPTAARAGEPAAPPLPEPPPVPSGLDAAAVRRVWPEILAAARQRSRSTEALLVNATVRSVDDDTLLLTIGSAPLARRLSDQRNTEVITESLRAVLGVQWRVRCEHGDASAPPPSARSRQQAAPPAAPPRRPSRPAPVRRSTASDDGVPLPPEPPVDEPPPDDEESMMAEAAADARGGPVTRRDPEEAAIELLSSQLGARTLDQR